MFLEMSKKAEEAGLLMEGALAGDRKDKATFFEQMSTGDISPTLLQAPLTARLVSEYEGIEPNWDGLAVEGTVDDFTLQEIFRIAFDDDSQVLEKNEGKTRIAGTLPRIGELGEYQSFGFSSSSEGYRAYKSGIKFGLSWEAIINGRSLSLLERATRAMARMARETEATEVVGQYVTPTGLNTANLGAENLLAGNPSLSLAAIEAGLAQAAQFTVNGKRRPVSGRFTLVVPPALGPLARQLVEIREVRLDDGAGTTTVSGNPIAGRITVKEVDTITLINGASDTFWFLVPDLNTTDGYRPELWRVRGNEQPRFFVKSTTLQSPEDGDFDHDAYETKLRATATGVNTGMLGVIASDGSDTP